MSPFQKDLTVFADAELWTRELNQEPSVEDLLSDPIAMLLMQRDGVRAEALEPILEQIALSLSARTIS